MLAMMATSFSMLYSCGNGHSKVYSALEKDMNLVEAEIHEANSCDDLQMLTFNIMGLRSDLENALQDLSVTEQEAEALYKMAEHLESLWDSKSEALKCDEQQTGDDDLVTAEDDDYDY